MTLLADILALKQYCLWFLKLILAKRQKFFQNNQIGLMLLSHLCFNQKVEYI